MILAIDFDGVIISDVVKPGFRMGEPIDGAIVGMQALKAAGHTLLIHTVRGDRPKHVMDWLKYWHVPFDDVVRLKPEADAYIDDRAIRFESWETLHI